MDHNNLSHYVFEFLGQNWSPGVKKWPFWAKIGYTKKLIFLKNPVKNFSVRPFFKILAWALSHWQKLAQVLKIALEGPKLPSNTSYRYET